MEQLYWIRYNDSSGYKTSAIVDLNQLQRYVGKVGVQVLEVVKL